MKSAKATPEDIRNLTSFFKQWEYLENIGWRLPAGQADTGNTEHLRHFLLGGDHDEDMVDYVRSEWLKSWQNVLSGSWQRVIYGYVTLVESCTDPDKNYLDYHPKFNYHEGEKATGQTET